VTKVPGRGGFVVLEGGDASGKTTQMGLLVERLRSTSREVVATFEPGATDLGRRIRSLLLDGAEPIDATAEALLLAADRAQHVAEIVRPALARGACVVSDRFVPSSLAYQGSARGLGVEAVEAVSRWASGGLEPDVVVVLDVSEEVAAARRAGTPDRMERESSGFHAEVRDAYRELAAERGWTLVDGAGPPETVAERVWAAVEAGLGRED
jgi:dTMP kinase